MPKLHDLSFLLNQIKNMAEIDERYYDYADTLTPYPSVSLYLIIIRLSHDFCNTIPETEIRIKIPSFLLCEKDGIDFFIPG